MLFAVRVECLKDRCRTHFLTVDRYRITMFVSNSNVLCLVRCLLRRDRPEPHILFRFIVRILQPLTLIGDVQQVGIHRVRLWLPFAVDVNAMRFRILQKLCSRVEIPLSPGCDHRDIRVKRKIAKLKTHLVVPLACRTVRDSIRPSLMCNFDLFFRNKRTRNGGTEQILPFVDRIGSEHWEDKIFDKLFTQVKDEDIFRLDAHIKCLLTCRLHLFTLSQIGSEGYHFTVVLILKPLENDTRIKSAAVCENCLFDLSFCHVSAL